MASNDGKRLLVLGLSFRQHHTLHMQQVLRAYERLPANPMDRGALYTGLFELAKDLDEDETQNLENWLKNGGEFPAPTRRNAPPTPATDLADLNGDFQDGEGVGEWPEYNPEDFEDGSSDDGDEGSGDEDEGSEDEDEDEDDEDEDDLEEEGGEDNDMSGDEDEMEEVSDFEGMDHRPRFVRRTRPKGKATGVSIECLICADEFDSSEFPATTQVTSSCHHKNDERVCVYCLQQSIATAVTEAQLHLIICPFCPEKLSHNEVKQYATREIFARYFIPDPTIS
jgi:hypothetical protein